MDSPNSTARLLPVLLCGSAVLMGALAFAFWNGVIDVGEAGTLLGIVLGVMAVAELGVALVLYSRARS